MVDKVPPKVNAGSVQTTRQWVDANSRARGAAARKRISRHKLRDILNGMREWQA